MKKALKNEMIEVLNHIQFEGEKIVSRLNAMHQTQAESLALIFRRYLFTKLDRTKEEYMQAVSIEDIQNLNQSVTANYNHWFEVVNKKIDELGEDNDIADFIYQMKQEYKDIQPCPFRRVFCKVSRKES